MSNLELVIAWDTFELNDLSRKSAEGEVTKFSAPE